MTRQDATELVQGFFRTHQRESRGLNAHGLGVVMMGATPMTFEYRETGQALWCHGLVYRFTNPLRPEVLRALEQLQADPGWRTGCRCGATRTQARLRSLLRRLRNGRLETPARCSNA